MLYIYFMQFLLVNIKDTRTRTYFPAYGYCCFDVLWIHNKYNAALRVCLNVVHHHRSIYILYIKLHTEDGKRMRNTCFMIKTF